MWILHTGKIACIIGGMELGRISRPEPAQDDHEQYDHHRSSAILIAGGTVEQTTLWSALARAATASLFVRFFICASCVGLAMGIKFLCQGCDKKLHVKAFLAGKRGVCPHCGAKVRIPLASQMPTEGAVPRTDAPRNSGPVSATTAAKPQEGISGRASTSAVRQRESSTSASGGGRENDLISEAPEAVWYVRPPTGGQYGPADGEIIRRWLEEGRVSADSLVWREGWDDWKTADSVFPSLGQASTQTEPQAESPAPVATPPQEDLTQEPFAFSGNKPATSHAKTRLPSSSNARNVAIVVTLSLVCIGLLVALLMVLQNQG